MAVSTKPEKGNASPKQGDAYRCSACGMELQITRECGCKDPDHVHFQCCGKQMTKV